MWFRRTQDLPPRCLPISREIPYCQKNTSRWIPRRNNEAGSSYSPFMGCNGFCYASFARCMDDSSRKCCAWLKCCDESHFQVGECHCSVNTSMSHLVLYNCHSYRWVDSMGLVVTSSPRHTQAHNHRHVRYTSVPTPYPVPQTEQQELCLLGMEHLLVEALHPPLRNGLCGLRILLEFRE